MQFISAIAAIAGKSKTKMYLLCQDIFDENSLNPMLVKCVGGWAPPIRDSPL